MAELNSSDVRELLTAIRDALTVPRPASYEHAEASKQLLVDRAAMVRGILTSVAKHLGEDDCRNQARMVRELIAEHGPVTYPTRQAGGIPEEPSARGTGECPDPECWGCTYCEGPTDSELAEQAAAASSGETR